LVQLKAVLGSIRTFVEKITRDPSSLTRGALQN
jgi:hypothetical protein